MSAIHSKNKDYHSAYNHRKYVIFATSFVFLLCSYIYYSHISSKTYPSLTYPLSQYNVEIFNKIPNHSSAVTHQYQNKYQQYSKNVGTGMSTNIDLRNGLNSIYGPFVSQPAEPHEPFNATSLAFVTAMFILSIVLCS
jgi:hypothetical protein